MDPEKRLALVSAYPVSLALTRWLDRDPAPESHFLQTNKVLSSPSLARSMVGTLSSALGQITEP